MKSAMNDRRLLTDIFHDFDLTARGPAGRIDIVTQHPERRPDTLAVRDPDSRFKPAVGLGELILSEQSRRCVFASSVIRPRESFLERLDYQQATVAIRVCIAARIGLQFVVTPTVAANIKPPLFRIHPRAPRAIEIATPHQFPHPRI